MEGMIVGRMYCLDSVIETESKQGTRYILLGKGNCENSISFGRSRKLDVPSNIFDLRQKNEITFLE